MAWTTKQRVFVAEYLKDSNAARAARVAGYSVNAAKQIGMKLLTKPHIRAEVQGQIAEKCMPPEEVLMRLAEQARADIGPWLSNDGEIDIAKMKRQNATRIIRKVKRTERTGVSKDGQSWRYVTVEVELHDAHAALVDIGRHHKLFTDVTEQKNKSIWIVEIGDLLRQGKITISEVEQELGHDIASDLFKSIGLSSVTNRETQT